MFFISSSVLLNFLFYVVLSVVLFYLWMKYRFGYWKRKGIYSLEAKFPFGNIGPIAYMKVSVGQHMETLYRDTKKHPCAGLFMLHKQTLLINDLELIKKVLLKDYNSFQGHGFKSNKEVDPLSQHLFNLEGEDWKRIRVKLTPTFTSSKMKYMFDVLAKCADDMLECIKQDAVSCNVFEVKELIAKFSTDVIGSCAFGIQMNSFKDPDAEFRRMGKKIFSTGKLKAAGEMMSLLTPDLFTFLRLSLNFPEVTKFFSRIVPETINYRKDNNITRNDFLQLLIDMKNKDSETGESLSMEELSAQVFIFFGAGFETSSTTASYALLELAKQPKIQDTLKEELDRVVEENGGKVTYDAVTKMTYLTRVVEETLRLYPVLPFLSRSCSANYTIPGTTAVIEKGTLIMIPVLGIQRDPDIYPDPMKFDPERFSPENVAKRHAFAHLPFGEGPRVCIGSRFGMLQVKLALTTILLHFDVSLCEETKLPLVYDPQAILLHSIGGLYLKLTRRS